MSNSSKRSERLRSFITSTLNDAAADAAPVTITGSGLPNITSEESRVKNSSEAREPETQENSPPIETPLLQQEPPITEETASISFPTEPNLHQEPSPNIAPTLHVPQRLAKSPAYQKANMTLYPRDLASLELYDKKARSYGFRLRKGGNPSLFIRTGLRLLEQLLQDDPQEWINQVAATMLATEDAE